MSAGRRWPDALAAAAIVRAGGASLVVRARAGPVRDRLLALLDPDRTALRLPVTADPAMLAGGVDVLASMAAGRRVDRPDLAARGHARVVIVGGAERLPRATAALLAAAVDRGGLPRLVLLDEAAEPDEAPPTLLADRIAMQVDLAGLSLADTEQDGDEPLPEAPFGEDPAATLVEAASALGIADARVPLHALAVARASAALGGRREPGADDLLLAARLAMPLRAVDMPAPVAPPPGADREADAISGDDKAAERVVAAVRSVLPVALAGRPGGGGAAGGRAAARRSGAARGSPGPIRAGAPTRGRRLDLVGTLSAAAPWQRVRGRLPDGPPRLAPADLRIRHRRPLQQQALVLAVDASGSAALARLAEVKGAVEHLLQRSYARRDEVGLVAFRGTGATLLLPPTRSLARARRELAALPGGGATPLAAGLALALAVAEQAAAAGRAPALVVLTDGGANVARDGSAGRAAAHADALAAARAIAAAGMPLTVVDSSPRGDARVAAVATAAGGRYLALPRLDGGTLAAMIG